MTANFYLRWGKLWALSCILPMLWACAPAENVEKFSGYAQGTTYHVSYVAVPGSTVQAVKKMVEDELVRLDQQISNYRSDSAIERFNANQTTEPQAVGEEIIALIEQARVVSEASSGCYDLTIKPLFDLWGFKADKLNIPDAQNLQTALQQVGFKQLDIVDSSHISKKNPQLRVDLGSIGQGYSVGRLAGLLEQQGITNYLVEIGGELQTRGEKPGGKPWKVALEKPLPGERTLQKVITINRTEPMSVMTSGTYRHYFDANGKRYSHILDARTGSPVDHSTVSVTVFDANPTLADAWGTALLCLGGSAGMAAANQAGIAALFIEQQGDAFNEQASEPLQLLKDSVVIEK